MNAIKIGILTTLCILTFCVVRLVFCSRDINMLNSSYNINTLTQCFLLEPEEIKNKAHMFMTQAEEELAQIIAIPAHEQTYQNSFKAFDNLCAKSNLALFSHLCSILESVSPRKEIRDTAHETIILLQSFYVDKLGSNKELYCALKTFANNHLTDETLSAEQKYFISETIADYERQGLNLSDNILEKISTLKKEIASLSVQFERNIAEDCSSIEATKEELAGVDDTFIARLQQDATGKYVLGVDYPTFFTVMENCTVENTRKRLSRAFNNRAYPMNETLLQEILKKRHELANLLGFKTYANLDLADQMAKNPETVETFLNDLLKKAHIKAKLELATWIKAIPDAVPIYKDDKIDPWNTAFLHTQYKKKTFNLDEQKIAEYFPLENTIKGLFSIYESFFDIKLKSVTLAHAWHPDVLCIELYDKTETVLYGTIFLDLFPREGKFSHAAKAGFIPTFFDDKNNRHPGAVIVMANFPKATPEKPSLLKRSDVSTFFHEFGHALHALFGATHIASLSGTNVKRDFVELPSQMLEEWLENKDILKMLSCHYITGEPLDDDTIDSIIKLKTDGSGNFLQRQIWLSFVSLKLHQEEINNDIYSLFKNTYETFICTSQFDEENHMYANFGHLCGYDSKYYGYMWSKVFALDLFEQIEKYGLLNPEMGLKYTSCILSKGGTCDPNELLKNFLGRPPKNNAFFKSLGL